VKCREILERVLLEASASEIFHAARDAERSVAVAHDIATE